ncbi:MAG: MOP flippase family protein [Rhodocyclales bacterium]|nr:MOP flippase family protein [Rhodocyclales bacterium]
MKPDLRLQTFSAVRWTTTTAVMRVVVQIAQLAVLARLLSPDDYGLMAMVGVVLSFGGLFADMGVNAAYVQYQEISPEQRSSLFWFSILASTVLMLLTVACGPLLADLLGDERLTPLIALSASTFVLNALGQQLRMSAEKALDFRPVALLEICAAILGLAAAVLAAFQGWGVYALVAGGIVTPLAAAALSWMFLARGWRPMRRLRLEDIRPFLGFGSAAVANNIVNQVSLTMDVILGGRMFSAAQLGLYSVPRNLTLQLQFMINPIITRVGFPLIAQVQSDVARVRNIYLQTLNMTASTNAPVYLGIAVFAPEIVAVVLGAGWDGAAGLLRVLALWGGVRSTGNPIGSLLFGMGRAGLALKWNLALSLIVLPAIWMGSLDGPLGMARALLGMQLLFFIPAWHVLVRPLCGAGLLEYSIAALRPFVIAGLAVAPAFLGAQHCDGAMARLTAGVAIAVPLYLMISFRFNGDWFGAMMTLAGRSPR